MKNKFTVKNNTGENLVVVKRIPKKHNGQVVIFVHGFAYYKEEDGMFDHLAEMLSEMGFITYQFDFSGCGESEGDFTDSTLTKLKEDLQSIIDFVELEDKIIEENLIFISQSFGTSVTISLHPKAKAAIMLGTLAHPKALISKGFGEGYKPNEISERKRTDGRITKVGPQFWQDLNNYDLPELVKEINYPLLFVHGSNDNNVPIDQMEEIFASANPPKEKIIISNADHGMRPKREELYEEIKAWILKLIK
jgi:uncharacterized protein